MNTSDDIIELTAKMEKLLAMLAPLENQGDRGATLFADGVRYRLSELRNAIGSGDRFRLSNILLDIVPSGKDLDAINFRLDLHPDINALSSAIEAWGAWLA